MSLLHPRNTPHHSSQRGHSHHALNPTPPPSIQSLHLLDPPTRIISSIHPFLSSSLPLSPARSVWDFESIDKEHGRMLQIALGEISERDQQLLQAAAELEVKDTKLEKTRSVALL